MPNFKKGQFGEGIFLAALVMVDKIAEEKGIKITGMPDMAKIRRTAEGRSSPLSSLFFMFFILPFLFGGGMLRRRMMFSPYYWGGSGGPRGFGSGGSGGFGGFGGGMGGSFGGGGASGRW